MFPAVGSPPSPGLLQLALAALWCTWNRFTAFLAEDIHLLPARFPSRETAVQIVSLRPYPRLLLWILCQVLPLNQALEIWVWVHVQAQRNRISLLEGHTLRSHLGWVFLINCIKLLFKQFQAI